MLKNLIIVLSLNTNSDPKKEPKKGIKLVLNRIFTKIRSRTTNKQPETQAPNQLKEQEQEQNCLSKFSNYFESNMNEFAKNKICVTPDLESQKTLNEISFYSLLCFRYVIFASSSFVDTHNRAFVFFFNN